MSPGYFGCNVCLRPILPADPRIQCLDCQEYDLCANCAVGGDEFSSGHHPTHRMCVFRSSGGGAQAPVASSSVAIVYRIAKTPSNAHTSLNSSHPAPQDFAPPASTPPPPHAFHHYSQSQGVAYEAPVLPPRQSMVITPSPFMSGNSGNNTPPPDTSFSTSAYTMPPRDAQPPNMDAGAALPQSMSRSIAEVTFAQTPLPSPDSRLVQPGNTLAAQAQADIQPQFRSSAQATAIERGTTQTMAPRSISSPPPPPPTAWGPFFETDMSPSPVFTVLMDAIFAYLDTRRTGSLTPEVYSRFLINQGYLGKQNIWNSNLVASMGKTKEECADAALKRAFDLFGIQYILRPRARDAPSPPADVKGQFQSLSASFARAISPAAPAAGMPLLTRTGFFNITAVEVLCDPARHYTGLAHVVQMYESGLGAVVRGWGTPLPRGVLPDEPDPRMLARIARVQAAVKEKRQSSRSSSGQWGQSGPGGLGSGVAGGLLSVAAYTRNAVGKIDAQGAVNVLNAAGNAAYIIGAVTND
ncbi:hypothetical protein DFH08DRAFT_974614 [Mycena albidolilacea]|uniref:ZZ-type domain-containing protein n=1 Tax=Mycena albidolilacea TaxID=1033008 RepID=A0AAD6Z6P3_9AGAR|nr:hypothetical protein DFH08DRAFT_974614 [Mycena albidolilacea]